MAKLDGAKVVVIGGASGVGYAVAAAALEAGADVVVGSSQAARIEGRRRGCKGRGLGGRLLRGGGPV
jgi:NAD(P)-dependent dehydrogenase (short-subunit alcohol dehydrogenase family)